MFLVSAQEVVSVTMLQATKVGSVQVLDLAQVTPPRLWEGAVLQILRHMIERIPCSHESWACPLPSQPRLPPMGTLGALLTYLLWVSWSKPK